MIKIIYIVRHGQTAMNLIEANAGREEPLTEEGLRQADIVAERLSHVEFDVLVASPLTRTVQTAEAISKRTGKQFDTSELFREIDTPTSLLGIPLGNPKREEFHKLRAEHINDPTWHYEDEENFFDAKERGLAALQYLIDRPEEKIAVVGHGHFKRFLIGTMIFGNEFTPAEWTPLARGLGISNTAITIVRYSDTRKSPWELITWNDHAHLGEIHTN